MYTRVVPLMPNERTVFRLVIAFTVGLLLALSATLNAQVVAPDSLALEHGVRVGWVADSVYQQLREAVHRKVETRFMVTAYRVGYWRDHPVQDSGFTVIAILECDVKDADSIHVRASCPNDRGPMIHTHVPFGLGKGDNSCSPSRIDLELQIRNRHVFDAIMCGDAPPTFYFFRQNPLYGYAVPLGTKANRPDRSIPLPSDP